MMHLIITMSEIYLLQSIIFLSGTLIMMHSYSQCHLTFNKTEGFGECATTSHHSCLLPIPEKNQ